MVSQNAVLLNRTMRENLCYGTNDEITDESIMEVLERVNMKERVLELPNGLDTLINQNGQEFSGGQLQRLQIARLLLSTSSVILLDEPTSAMDSMTTDKILNVLKEFLVDKTLIMVTHDVQPLMLTDTILNMKSGGEFDIPV